MSEQLNFRLQGARIGTTIIWSPTCISMACIAVDSTVFDTHQAQAQESALAFDFIDRFRSRLSFFYTFILLTEEIFPV